MPKAFTVDRSKGGSAVLNHLTLVRSELKAPRLSFLRQNECSLRCNYSGVTPKSQPLEITGLGSPILLFKVLDGLSERLFDR